MKLIGQLKTAGASWSMDEYMRLFGMLADIEYPNGMSRNVGYEMVYEGKRIAQFLGAEVWEITTIPDELIGLSIGQCEMTAIQPGKSTIHMPIEWLWGNEGMGEFSMNCPPEWSGMNGYQSCSCRLISLAAFQSNVEADDEVELVPYDPEWPAEYASMAEHIRYALGDDVALRIEHYGSTSIQGMPAKPVIDILVEIPTFEMAHERAIPALYNECCEYWSYADHMVFICRRSLLGKRTHHIHMAPAGHGIWNSIAFRDYLRTHSDEAAEYSKLKRDLASHYKQDREGYTQAKTDYVQRITALARSNSN